MKYKYSKNQKDILIGLLLGDGYLEYNGFKGTRLQVKQSQQKKEYVMWLYDQFAHCVRTKPKQRLDNGQWYFFTRYCEYLTELRNTFYISNIKIVPDSIADLLTSPLTLAIWYMDDGRLDFRKNSHYAYSISTDSFTKEQVVSLQRVLYKRFGIETSIHMSLCRGKFYPKIYIGKKGRDLFLDLIRPYILECFSYKLPQ